MNILVRCTLSFRNVFLCYNYHSAPHLFNKPSLLNHKGAEHRYICSKNIKGIKKVQRTEIINIVRSSDRAIA
jgi:hypothetical protein